MLFLMRVVLIGILPALSVQAFGKDHNVLSFTVDGAPAIVE